MFFTLMNTKISVSCFLRPVVFLQVTGDFVLTLGLGQMFRFKRCIQEVNDEDAAAKLVHSCQVSTRDEVSMYPF